MCSSPLHILNPKKYKNAVCDRNILEVPCGHCKECFDSRRNGFFIRMYFEYLDCLFKGGFAYFLTLTYRESSINRLPTGERCYRHDDVKNYLKLIRVHLQRDYGIESKDAVRYFCCSEFGEDRHRPHYHIIFFVTPPVPIRTFIYVARHQWQHGFTMPGKYNNGIVQDVAAFSYVSKYCTKGDKDCATYNHLMAVINSYSGYDEKTIRLFRYNCRPVIRSSKNFGLYLISQSDYEELEKGIVKMPDKKSTVKDFPLPLYYDRKIFYDVVMIDGTPCYRLNEAGLKMKLVRFQRYKESFHKNYDLVMSTKYSPTLFDEVNFHYGTEFTSNSHLFAWFSRCHSRDWTNLFHYSLVYNGYSHSGTDSLYDGIVTSAMDDFSTRLRLFVGFPVTDDELSSLNMNSSFYHGDYSLCLRIFRHLVIKCNIAKSRDFYEGEAIRHRLTSMYYNSNVYNQ